MSYSRAQIKQAYINLLSLSNFIFSTLFYMTWTISVVTGLFIKCSSTNQNPSYIKTTNVALFVTILCLIFACASKFIISSIYTAIKKMVKTMTNHCFIFSLLTTLITFGVIKSMYNALPLWIDSATRVSAISRVLVAVGLELILLYICTICATVTKKDNYFLTSDIDISLDIDLEACTSDNVKKAKSKKSNKDDIRDYVDKFNHSIKEDFDIDKALNYLVTCTETKYGIKDKMLLTRELYNKSQSTKYIMYHQLTSYRMDKVLISIVGTIHNILKTSNTAKSLTEISKTLDTLIHYLQKQLNEFDLEIEHQTTEDAEYIKQTTEVLQDLLDKEKFIKGEEL